MIKKFNFITLGYDCSPATALRNMNFRDYALPFDWIVSNIHSIDRCFQEDFKYFHKNLRLNSKKNRLIDEYGFEFPHDYPLKNIQVKENDIGEGIIPEENNNTIIDNWNTYHELVLEKYNRRIQRLKNILNEELPIIVLCRYSTNDVILLKKILFNHFNKKNIYFINSFHDNYENDYMISINTEVKGVWNDTDIWKKAIDDIISRT